MTERSDDCASFESDLSALRDGELTGPEAAAAEAHLRGCGPCAALARDLAAVGRVLRDHDPADAVGPVSAGFRARVLLEAGLGSDSGASRRGEEGRDLAPVLALRADRRPLAAPLAAAAAGFAAALGGWLAARPPADAVPSPSLASAAIRAADSADADRLLRVAAERELAGDVAGAASARRRALGLAPAGSAARAEALAALGVESVAHGAPTREAPAPGDAAGAADAPLEGVVGAPAWELRAGSWRFDSPAAWDAFLDARERARHLDLVAAARAASAREDAGVSVDPRETVTIAAAPVPAPNALARALAGLEPSGVAETADGLTVLPLRGPASASGAPVPSPGTLAAALAERRVSIRDAGRDRRAALVTNTSRDRALLVLAGEILEGGSADRMVARDTLVPAGARDVPVPVVSVEAGRAPTRIAARFSSSPGVAGARLRCLGLGESAAALVSDIVRRDLSLLGVASLERSLSDAFRERGPAGPFLRSANRQVEELVRALQDPRTTGFALAHGREILVVEAFATPELLQAHARRLLLGYAVEAGTRRGGGPAPEMDAVRAFLADASGGACFSVEGPSGASTEWGVVTDAGLLGGGVASGESLLHAAVFGGAAARGDGGSFRGGRGASMPTSGGADGAPSAPGGSSSGDDGSGGSGGVSGDGTTTGGDAGTTPESGPSERPR
jgi:hypothetical protein